jgi:hypothetical protein
MSYVSRLAPGGAELVAAAWSDLVEELDSWRDCGRTAQLWWRDDDAVEPTPALDRLLSLVPDIPIALAVIPARARSELAACLAAFPRVTIWQHGWAHIDHAMHGKKSEYPTARRWSEIAAELTAGRDRLAELFDARFVPVLVPPWNRFAAELLPLLKNVGFVGLSAMAPTAPRPLPPGIAALDAHVDLVAWRAGRRFIGQVAALSAIVRELRARRAGNSAEPVGILTHHLVMEEPAAAFLVQLCGMVREHDAARWILPA